MRARMFVVLLALAVLSCGAEQGQSQAQEQDKKKGTVVEIDGLSSTAPAEWTEEKPTSKLRVKQFRLTEVKSDKDPAEVVIFFFGEGQGGGLDENLKRWKGMFVPPEGKKIDDVTKVEKMKVGSVPAAYVDIHGTYLFKARPFDPEAETMRRPNYRMISVIFESPKGPYFFRLVGPADTVEHYKKDFDKWVKGFK